jgi:hypothetical protein
LGIVCEDIYGKIGKLVILLIVHKTTMFIESHWRMILKRDCLYIFSRPRLDLLYYYWQSSSITNRSVSSFML